MINGEVEIKKYQNLLTLVCILQCPDLGRTLGLLLSIVTFLQRWPLLAVKITLAQYSGFKMRHTAKIVHHMGRKRHSSFDKMS